jgi:DNA segregation ATPase FtsK/SpoIIIE, S-DNA-T family
MSNIERYREESLELLADAREFIAGRDSVKVSDLQRRFLIGYVKASVLMDMLYEYGYVSEYITAQPRKVLI